MATPSLTLAPDVQQRYTQAMSDPNISGNPQAVQQLQQSAQQQSAQEKSSVPATPSLNQPSPGTPGSFLQTVKEAAGKVGSFAKNNLPTIGAIALPAITDLITGGLAIPADAGLAAVGGAAGEAGKQGLNGQGVSSGSDLVNDAEQGVINGVGGAVGGVAAAGAGKILGIAGDALSKGSDDAAVQALGLTTGGRNQFFQKTGSVASDFLKSENLVGGTADDVQAAQDALQAQYNSIARQSGIKVPVSDVRQSLVNNLSGLIHDDTDEGATALETTMQKAQNIISRIPKDADGNIDIGELTNQKANVQSATKFSSDSTAANIQANQLISQTLKDTVNGAADKAGLTAADGTPLSEMGQRLNKFNTLNDIISKREPGQVGTSLLTKVARGAILPAVGGAVGDKVGGAKGALIGGAIGLGGDAALTNPAVLAGISSAAGKAGSALSSIGAPAAAKMTAANAVTQGIIGTAENGASPAATPQPLTSATTGASSVPSTPSLTPSTTDPLQSGIQALQSGQPLSTAEYTALENASAVNPKIQAGITAAYQASNPTATQGISTAANAAENLNSLLSQAGGAKGGIVGGIESAIGSTSYGDQAVQAYNEQSSALAQEIISQLYGGSASVDQTNQVMQSIPKITDSSAVAQSKIATLKQLIAGRAAAVQNSTPSQIQSQLNSPSLNL